MKYVPNPWGDAVRAGTADRLLRQQLEIGLLDGLRKACGCPRPCVCPPPRAFQGLIRLLMGPAGPKEAK